MKDKIIESIKSQLIIPVVRRDSYELANKMIHYLNNYGIKIVEITLSIPNAFELMKKWSSKGMIIGAGTVFSIEEAQKAIDANVSFIVSPVQVEGLVELCHKNDIPCALGALTPNEVMNALAKKADIVKIYPAKSMGSVDYVKSIQDVFPNVLFMPTGGIGKENINMYLESNIYLLGVGNSLIDDKDLLNDDFESIQKSLDSYFKKGRYE